MSERRSLVGGWQIFATLIVTATVLWVVRFAIIPFIIAAVIGFVTQPVLEWAQRRMGGRRWPGVVLLYLVVVGFFGFVAYWIASTAARDLVSVASRLPQIARGLITAATGPHGIKLLGTTYTPEAITAAAFQALHNLIGPPQLATLATVSIGLVVGGFLTLVLIPYFMVSGPRLAAGAIWLVPPERRHSVIELLPKLVPMLRRYIVGICAVVLYTSVVGWLGFGLLFRLPHAVLLSVAVGMLELIPAVGPMTSMALVGLTGLQQTSTLGLVFLMGYAIALRLSIDNLVGPLVLGRSVKVHPVVVMFAFVCGAMLFGVIGLLFAVPVAACIRLVLSHYYAEPIAPGGDAEPKAVQMSPQSSVPVRGTAASDTY
ncbi:MAG: AI-2E family transporter [Acetobacteraceae bacterium]